MADITISANDIASAITKGLEGFSPSLEQQTVGHVAEVGDGIARVSGLPKCAVNELLQFEEDCLSMGFEGVILRDPDGLHKSGRSTVKSGAYLRIKRFIDFEGVVVNLVEAMENQNEAKTNELGNTERSTHKENMVPKGMVGTIQLRSLQDVVDANGNVLIAKDQVVDVGPGNMVHSERIRAWESFVAGAPDSLVGKVAKSKFFPKGQKDLPRFPTFVSLRAEEDMSE